MRVCVSVCPGCVLETFGDTRPQAPDGVILSLVAMGVFESIYTAYTV